MKKIQAIRLFTIILLLFSCKGNSEKAMEYNNAIAQELQTLADIEKEMAIKDGPELDSLIVKYKKSIPESREKIEQFGSFQEDDSLKLAALNICDFYTEVINGKWSQKGPQAIQSKNEELDLDLQKKQIEFATKFKFEINK